MLGLLSSGSEDDGTHSINYRKLNVVIRKYHFPLFYGLNIRKGVNTSIINIVSLRAILIIYKLRLLLKIKKTKFHLFF